ncbi:MAG: hypothetical protein K2W96_25240 [Gemmataceae bacterium]|nr:hypothetical protein [Gemmataceae bacterium]
MSRDRDDRYDDEPPIRRGGGPAAAGSMPGAVFTAALIWVIYGFLLLVTTAIGVVMLMSLPKLPIPPGFPDPMAFVMMVAAITFVIVASIAAVFLFFGFRTLAGTARDTLGGGITALIFGVLCTGLGGIGFIAQLNPPSAPPPGMPQMPPPTQLDIVRTGVELVAHIALLVSGILALQGRQAYKAWRYRRDGDGGRDRRDDYDDRRPTRRDDRDDYDDRDDDRVRRDRR